MMRNPIVTLGFAAAMALAASAAPAQTNQQQMPPQRGNTQMNPPPSGGKTMNEPQASKADRRFITEAIQGDLAEVQIGKLAQEKGQSEEARQFGKMLEQDHSEHLQKAQSMAEQIGVTAPNAPNARQKAAYDRLSKMSGAQFDRAFKRDMLSDHRKDISEYRKEAKSKGPLAQFAEETIPTLQKHLQTAERIPSEPATTGAR